MFGYSLEIPCRCISNDYPKHMFFYGEIRKYYVEAFQMITKTYVFYREIRKYYVDTPSYLEQSGYLKYQKLAVSKLFALKMQRSIFSEK